MSLRDKIDVDPLGDVRMAKIRKALFERLDGGVAAEPSLSLGEAPARAGAWLRTGGIAALALAAAAALLVFAAAHWPAASGPLAGATPSRIVTEEAASHIDLGDNAIDVAPASALLTSGDDAQGVLLVLERGSVTCEVAPRRGRPAFVVQAGSTRVRVVGTRFTATRVGDGARVDVAHGVVEVASGGQTFVVSAGQSWPEGSSPAVAAGGAASVASGVLTVGPGDLPVRKKAVDGATAQRSAPARAGIVAEPSVESTPAAARDPEPSAQELFEEASGAEKRDPALAASLYDKLAGGSSPWASNALFARGRLEADLGRTAQARQTLAAYLVRFPSGRNAADARALLGRLR